MTEPSRTNSVYVRVTYSTDAAASLEANPSIQASEIVYAALKKAFDADEAGRGKPLVLADNNMPAKIVDYLKTQGLHVVDIKKTPARSAEDAHIYYAVKQLNLKDRLGISIITKDKHFLDISSGVENAPAVAVFSGNLTGNGDPSANPRLRDALDDFVRQLKDRPEELRGRTIKYEEDGTPVLAVINGKAIRPLHAHSNNTMQLALQRALRENSLT